MDVQLHELIEKIKKDGIASAESNAKKIIEDAQKKAESIISDAEAKADSIIKAAKDETARLEKASEDAIAQSGRNLIIAFRDGINKELQALINEETEKVYDKDLLKKLIPDTVKAWSSNLETDELTVLLPAKDLKALESNFKTSLKAKISKGLEIKGDSSLSSGFRIGAKNGSAFYDFSAEEVASLFGAYLNPKVTALMKKAAESVVPEKTASKAENEKPKVSEEKTAAKAKVPAAKAAPAAKKIAAKPAAKTGTSKASEKKTAAKKDKK